MIKIAFMGAGSTIFAKNILGDIMDTPVLKEAVEIALYDINGGRLSESYSMLANINQNINNGKAKIITYLGEENRRAALKNAKYVINAIQVGGYEPCTLTDFTIAKKFGLRQTIADTLGIGGIFRALRTIPVLFSFARDIEEVCPDAWLLNYTNPMASLTGAMLRYTNVKTVGLCHSVQTCAETLLNSVNMPTDNVQYHIAGINHMAWLLDIRRNGVDLYPEIKRRASEINQKHDDMVRHEIMQTFGYYVTESSEHNAEYMPYWIKRSYPELIERFNIPLDEYPRRCIEQIAQWDKQKQELTLNADITHTRTREYASYIIEAIETDRPYKIGGNVLNHGIITNLPSEACVEVPCLVDGTGITPCFVGNLPQQLAALNRTNINTQLLTIEAAITHKRDAIYHAALLDPHTSAELSIDDIRQLCDELIEAHGNWLPAYH